mmetsp:Transcript_28957/g.77881  ORF Transcript_28957/g.77881 Transcript_28957/m.77881 type:complete len:409 (-) Transcript_28957:342-1568(-)
MGVVESTPRRPSPAARVSATGETADYFGVAEGHAEVKQEGSLLTNVRYEYIGNTSDSIIMLADYKLAHTLGKGTSGQVRLAKHTSTGDKVAVKIIKKKDGSRDVPMPKEELRCLRTLRHENIVRLHHVVDTPKSLYLVMECCDTDLLSFLNTCPVWLTEMTASRLFAQVLEGVRFCHSLGVCHRDLKLENLLLSGTTLKIADFGLSKFVDLDNRLESYAGSPQYLAPELVEEALEFDGTAADMWSCGVVMYALLFRGLPFDDENVEAILRNIKRGQFRTTRPVTSEASDLLTSLLTAEPTARASAATAQESAWIVAHRNGEPDQILPGLSAISLPHGTSMKEAAKAVSTDTMLMNVAKRLELKRKAEAAGIRMPSIPGAMLAAQGKHGEERRAQDDNMRRSHSRARSS